MAAGPICRFAMNNSNFNSISRRSLEVERFRNRADWGGLELDNINDEDILECRSDNVW
jgi:hypothetical protein